jgi:hypothetical protein
MGREAQNAFTSPEEVLGHTWHNREKIIIEIKVFLIQPFNSMKVHFNRIAVEGRQKVNWDNILMKDYFQMFRICPLRDLRRMRYYQINISDEGHIDFNTPEQILQCSPIPKALLHDRHIGIFLIVLLPHRIVAINVSDYYIHQYITLINFLYMRDLSLRLHPLGISDMALMSLRDFTFCSCVLAF